MNGNIAIWGVVMKKVAIVTGASGDGIGRSTALSLAKIGFNVIVNYRSHEKDAIDLCSHIRRTGGEASPVKGDVFLEEDCDYLIRESLRVYSRIDACVIGPGAGWNPESPENLKSSLALSDLEKEIKPVYYLVPRLLRHMKERGGSIIGIASNPDLPSPSYSYNVSKKARIDALLELSGSCWKNRIRVNVVAPGPVEHFRDFPEALEAMEHCPLDRITPQSIAETIALLCSDRGAFITGNVIKFHFT